MKPCLLSDIRNTQKQQNQHLQTKGSELNLHTDENPGKENEFTLKDDKPDE